MNQGVSGSFIIPQSPWERLWKSFGTAVTGCGSLGHFSQTRHKLNTEHSQRQGAQVQETLRAGHMALRPCG